MKRNHGLNEKETELVKLLMADCHSTSDIQDMLKRLFAGTIEQMLEAEMDEHQGYEKKFSCRKQLQRVRQKRQ